MSENFSFTHKHNFPNGECLREDLGEKTPLELYDFTMEEQCVLEEILPYCEYGFHTIKSIKILNISKEKNLLS